MNLRTVFARMLARDRAGVEPIIKVPTTAGAVAHIADPYRVLGNPILTLTPASVAAMFEASTRGEMTRIQWVMYHAERTDSDLFALRDRRTSSVVEMDWTAKEMTADTVDPVLAREQAAAVQISKGASGYLPFSSSVLFGDAERGPIPFEAHVRFLSEKMVLAGPRASFIRSAGISPLAAWWPCPPSTG